MGKPPRFSGSHSRSDVASRRYLTLRGHWPDAAVDLGADAPKRLDSSGRFANQLNARKVATARGGKWTHVQVRQIVARAPNSEDGES
jgi:hypothetical protein